MALGPHDIVRPDLAGWRRHRLPDPGDRRPIDVVPDWVCEILSPSTSRRDRVTKRNLYAEHGIPSYWIIDADTRTLEAFELSDKRWVLAGAYDEAAVARIAPFEEIRARDRPAVPAARGVAAVACRRELLVPTATARAGEPARCRS